MKIRENAILHFKILAPGRRAPKNGYVWPKLGVWTPERAVSICYSGWHVVTAQSLVGQYLADCARYDTGYTRPEVYICEVAGDSAKQSVAQAYKEAWSRARLLKLIGPRTDAEEREAVERFIKRHRDLLTCWRWSYAENRSVSAVLCGATTIVELSRWIQNYVSSLTKTSQEPYGGSDGGSDGATRRRNRAMKLLLREIYGITKFHQVKGKIN